MAGYQDVRPMPYKYNLIRDSYKDVENGEGFYSSMHWMSFGLYVYLYCVPAIHCPEWAKIRLNEIEERIGSNKSLNPTHRKGRVISTLVF